ncbi:hypothetical protein AB5N96_12130 [Chryseomicrobium imtechense]
MRYLVRSINEDVISEGDKEVIFEDREVAEKRAHELNLLTEHTWKVIPLSDDLEKDI